ncbi:MAG: hypothetical protein NC131_18215 [Roseburia sp.]|nr:hypothetical protein [Roseburia sp.]
MTFNEFITNRINKISAELVSRGQFPDTNPKLRQVANKYCGVPAEYVELPGDFKLNLQRYVLSSSTKDEYEDITFLKNPLIFGIIIHVKSTRQIFVHKSVKSAHLAASI